MLRRSVMFKAVALLMAVALILSSFGVVSAGAVRPQDDEPVYDMMGLAYLNTHYRLIKFNSEDPAVWDYQNDIEIVYPTDIGDLGMASSIVKKDEYYFMASYMGEYLTKYDEEFNLISSTTLIEPKTGYICMVFDMNYSEFDGLYYAMWTNGGVDWGIATIDLEMCELDPVFAWSENDGSLYSFWPVAFAPMPDGDFLVINAWDNCLYSVNAENYLNPIYITTLPELATLFPLIQQPEQYMPQDMHYNAETGIVCWCSGNAYDCTNFMIMIDVATGAVINSVDMQAEGMPLEAPEGYDPMYYNFPIIGIDSYSEAEAIALGDVDGDGDINAADALLIMRYAMSIITELDHLDKADVDGSGEVDIADALLVMRMAMGMV